MQNNTRFGMETTTPYGKRRKPEMKSYSPGAPIRKEDQLYIKVGEGRGARYHPIARFEGFPADGIWIVESTPGRSRLSRVLPPEAVEAHKIGELPDAYVADRVALERRLDEVCKAIEELRRKGAVSNADIAGAVFDTLAKEPGTGKQAGFSF